MAPAHLQFTPPFDLNDVRIAARKLLGVKLLLPAVEIELRLAVVGYHDRLRSLASAGMAGGRMQHMALRRVETSPAARLIAFVLANGKRKHITPMTWAAIKADAVRVNLRKPSSEVVFATERLKRSGGTRWTCSFGPRARAAQCMVGHIISVVAGPSRYEHARKGRGRETAVRDTLHGIDMKGVRWVGLLDVKDFFPSITREMVKEVLSFLPQSIIDSTVFIHDDTEIRLHSLYGGKDTSCSALAIRKGIPQGSLASPLVAGKVLERHLDKIDARHAVSFVDNVLIGGKTQEEVQAKRTALATSLEGHPSGSLRLTGEIYKLGDHTMDYLGYRFRREWPNPERRIGRATHSERSRRAFYTRLAAKLLLANWRSREATIDKECARWVRSFPQWRTRYVNEATAAIAAEVDLVPMLDSAHAAICGTKTKWTSFADLADYVSGLAVRIGNAMPRLHTKGGAASFERISPDATSWERFEALLQQGAKNIVIPAG